MVCENVINLSDETELINRATRRCVCLSGGNLFCTMLSIGLVLNPMWFSAGPCLRKSFGRLPVSQLTSSLRSLLANKRDVWDSLLRFATED